MDPYTELVKLRNQRGTPRPADPARPWYRIENHSAPATADVWIFDIIGADPFFGGISAAQFTSDLRAITAKNIILHINSIGGDVFEAKAMRTALAEHPANIETHIAGIAASAASWVGLATNKVVMAPKANLMIHEPSYIVAGDAAAMRKAAAELDMFGNEIASMYQEKASGTVDGWRAQMQAETWFSDQSAVAAGLADEISGPPAAQNSIANLIESTFARLIGEAPASIVNTQPDPELVRSALIYQRDESRRLGVA